MAKRPDKDQVGIAFRLAKHTKGQNYKDLNENLKDAWYRRAGLFIALAKANTPPESDGIVEAERILDFVEGTDIV